jgi:hypothetical protein
VNPSLQIEETNRTAPAGTKAVTQDPGESIPAG